MRYSTFVLILAAAAVLTTAYRQGQPAQRLRRDQDAPESRQDPKPQEKSQPPAAQEKPADKKPLLLLDDEPPLLLDDNGDDPSAQDKKMADNSRCHVCHLNYADEAIALVHAKAGIGCVKCHGDCDEHIADESWASGGNGTPPGKMYRRQEVDACCEDCHKHHDAPAWKVVARWEKCRPKQPQKLVAGTIVCTDCHGDHRLAERKCKWK